MQIYTYILFHFGLSQDIEYRSLYYVVGPFYTQQFAFVNPKLQIHPSPLVTSSLFFMSVSLFPFCR